MEFVQNVNFAACSLRVVERGPRGHMVLDFETQKHLELVSNVRRGGQKETLFGVLDFTHTDVGKRKLRSSLLSPPNQRATVEGRLDAVALLLRHEGAFQALATTLKQLPALDQMLSHLVVTPKTHNKRSLREGLTDMLALKSVLALANSPKMVGALDQLLGISADEAGHVDPVLGAIRESLTATDLAPLAAAIDRLLEPEARAARGRKLTSVEARHEEAFAVRAGIDGDLDVARQARIQTMCVSLALLRCLRAA